MFRLTCNSHSKGLAKISLFILLSFISTQLTYAYYKAIISENDVNIRVDSSALSSSLGYLKKGDLVKVVEEKYDWCKILLPKDKYCYVSAQFLRKISDNKVEVIASQLNLRSGPSRESYIVGKVNKGAILFVKEELKNGWLKVRGHPYMCGWVNKKFLQRVKIMQKQDVEISGTIFLLKRPGKCKTNYLLKNKEKEELLRVDGGVQSKFLNRQVKVIGRRIKNGCSYFAVKEIFKEP
jgi:uncharacterized protein YgiM (DUF1202 family)